MANKTGYMDNERATSENYHKEHLEWLKNAQTKSRDMHKEYLAWLKGAQAKSREIRQKFIATNREYAKTLGKFDDYREQARKMKY